MTQSNHHPHHRRTPSSNGSKLRTSRPTVHRKSTSLVNSSVSKLGSAQTRYSESDDDHQPEMAASFLNFCAMCERQITVPDNSLLYCSERCRRKDSHKPLPASFPSSASMSFSTSPPTSPPMSPRTIVAAMTPTRLSMSSTPAIRIPSQIHNSKSDLDPTEWKPVIPGSSSPLASSDAWHYLSQFHGRGAVPPVRRSGAGHRSSASLSTLMSGMGALPSLAHTPSTAASSFGSDTSDYMNYVHDAALRPLPPRHNPYFSSGPSATKGVELVVPHVDPRVVDVTATDMPDDGSIFPASSSLWENRPSGKARTSAVALSSTAL